MATAIEPTEVASLIAVQALSAVKIYGKGETAVKALDDISLPFEAQRFTAIMGPSGSGKSTLLHCLAGLDKLTSGQIMLGGKDLGAMSDTQLTKFRRANIGFVFQSFNLVPTLSARDNITLPITIAGKKPDREWVDKIIDVVGLRSRLSHRPAELSGGQQQRVAAARALASRPAVIFADEPTGNLDSRSGEDLLSFLRQAVQDFKQTIVMVTHDPIAASHADRVVFLVDGRVVTEMHEPSTDAILTTMKTLGG